MPRGGYRPGSGAKPGNTNAIKNGRRSPRLRALRAAVRSLPELVAVRASGAAEAEWFGYYYRFIGELLLRSSRGRLPDDLRHFTDRDALKFMLEHWKPNERPPDPKR
jgi:hypothetical protein